MEITQGIDKLKSYRPEAVRQFGGGVYIYFPPSEVEAEGSEFFNIAREENLGMIFEEKSSAHKSEKMYAITPVNTDTEELASRLGLDIKDIKDILAGKETPDKNVNVKKIFRGRIGPDEPHL